MVKFFSFVAIMLLPTLVASASCPDLTGTCVSKTHSAGPEYVGIVYTMTQSGCTAIATGGGGGESFTVTKNGDSGATLTGTGLSPGGWTGTVVGTKFTSKANDGSWSSTADCTWTNNPFSSAGHSTYSLFLMVISCTLGVVMM